MAGGWWTSRAGRRPGWKPPAAARCDAAQVSVQRLTGPDADYLFVFNYGQRRVIRLEADGPEGSVVDALTGETVGAENRWEAELDANGVGIYRLAASEVEHV